MTHIQHTSCISGVWLGGKLQNINGTLELIPCPHITTTDELIKVMIHCTATGNWEALKIYDWMFKSVDVVDSWILGQQLA